LIQVLHGLGIGELGKQLADMGAHLLPALGFLLRCQRHTLKGQLLAPPIGPVVAEEELLVVDVGRRPTIDLHDLDLLDLAELLAVGAVFDLLDLEGLLLGPLGPRAVS
jgi:hypothetical protein